MTSECNSFASWLKSRLDESTMSARELAQKAGISKPLVYFYLTGKRLPTPQFADKIKAALETTEDIGHLIRMNAGRPPVRK